MSGSILAAALAALMLSVAIPGCEGPPKPQTQAASSPGSPSGSTGRG